MICTLGLVVAKRPGRGALAKRSAPAGLSQEGEGVAPGCHPAEFRVGPMLVVVDPLGFDPLPCLVNRDELIHV